MTETPTLETPRFILRPMAPEDVAALFPTFADEDAMRWWARAKFESEAELAEWLLDPGWTGRSWAAVPKAGGPAVARFIAKTAEREIAEIGYLVALGHQGQGIAREGLAAVIDLMFAEGHRKVFADVDPDNAASNRVVEALGFTLEATLRANWHTHIGTRDSLIWGLLKDEWPSQR